MYVRHVTLGVWKIAVTGTHHTLPHLTPIKQEFCLQWVFQAFCFFFFFSCLCKELKLKKTVVIAGSVTDEGEYLLDESSYVRHASEHLLKKVQERTKRDKCSKITKQP